MKYEETLNKALAITWKYKILWLVGIVIVLFSAGSAGPSSMLQWTSSMDEMPAFITTHGAQILSQIQAVLIPLVTVSILLGLIMTLVSIVVNFTGQGMLIDMVDGINHEQEPVFKDSINRGWENFWKLFLIQVLVNIAVFVVVIIELIFLGILAAIIIGIFMLLRNIANALGLIWIIPIGVVWGIITLAVFIATAGVAQIIAQLAYRETILNDLDIQQALGAALKTFRSKTGPAAGSWGMQIVLSLIFGVVEGIITMIILVVLGTLLWISMGLAESLGLSVIVALPLILLLGLFSLFLGALYQVAKSAMWTLFFRQLEELSIELPRDHPEALSA